MFFLLNVITHSCSAFNGGKTETKLKYYKPYVWFSLFVLLFRLIPESPRWNLSKGRTEQVLRALQKIARMNGNVLIEESCQAFKKVVSLKKVPDIKINQLSCIVII